VPPGEAAHFVSAAPGFDVSAAPILLRSESELTVSSHLMPTFARVDLAFERGEGVWLIATNGERYLDFCSGVAVNALGHSHPQLVAALEEQARKVWHVSNL
jgi:acetylornithine/succinyldiaminopimelate/putrescine aminotransferase